MSVTIIFFGQLAEITGTNRIGVENVTDTDSLLAEMNRRYPAFQAAKFVVAVDQQLISGNTLLNGHQTVAFLPPFSGG